ncbi:MAG: AAA family ATPase [Sulfuriferula sp.]|nr:AAA family ATPase [Sulfuriferula sp.]
MTANISNQIETTVLHEILSWSINRPEWQRDALRRIVETGSLTDVDLLALEGISRSKLKIDSVKSASITTDPLRAEHLPPTPGAAASVSLVSIGDLQHVNRLPQGSTIPFGNGIGLTIIYGENGAGKSSYARVIKRACRARGVPPNIRSNVFSPSIITKPASAKIVFKTGTTEVSVAWSSGAIADPRLANIFVFDSFSAEHYVSVDNAAAFTPYGLDVLPTLSKACDALAERLKFDVAKWRTAINGASASWEYDSTTEVGKCIQKLSATTQVADINVLAGFDQKQAQQLVNLREVLKADPLQKAKETRAAISRIELYVKRVSVIANDLADDKVEVIRKQLEDAIMTESTAKAFALSQFDTSFLAGTGSELWRAMWDAARTYSNSEAYPDQDFPVVMDDARCVLCQQELNDDGGKKLSRFDAFCKDMSQQVSLTAEQTLSTTLTNLNAIIPLAPELDKVDADLAVLTAEQRTLLSEFTTKADARLEQLKKNLLNRHWATLTGIPISPETIIRSVITNLEDRAKTEESAHNPGIRKNLEVEFRELDAREWLAGIKDDILAQLERLKAIAELEGCEKNLKTAPITAKSTELTQQFVTKAFQERFKDELKALGLKTLDVELESVQGKKAETKFGLRLVSAGSSKVMDIASEGEQRCIALAAFLSELSQASHQSALVFDDPVSSLDHWHRERIADRLVVEAKQRQVIVFTHDVVFLNDLLAFAEKTMMTPNVLTLEWNDGAPGRYVEGLPWDSKKPLDCLTELEKSQAIISAKWNPQPNGANIEAMRHGYSRLRSTLERVVEVELLDGIVCRFESQINAGRVKSLIGITQAECDEVKRLLNKCHQITDAHAPSTSAIPDPTEFMQDITNARQLVADIKKRKKQNQAVGGKP